MNALRTVIQKKSSPTRHIRWFVNSAVGSVPSQEKSLSTKLVGVPNYPHSKIQNTPINIIMPLQHGTGRDTTISTSQVTYTIRTYSPAIFIVPTTQLMYYSCESPLRTSRFAHATCTVISS